MEVIAITYQSIANKMLHVIAENLKIKMVDSQVYDSRLRVINTPELAWLKKHGANEKEFLKNIFQHRLNGFSTFDPYLESCPTRQLLRQRFEDETAKLEVLRIARTRLTKYKFLGITRDLDFVAREGNPITAEQRRQNGMHSFSFLYRYYVCYVCYRCQFFGSRGCSAV